MQQLVDIRPVALPPRAVHRIDKAKGQSVTCFKGTVWITQANDPRDIILGPGQSFTLDRKGPAVVFALKEAAILVGPAGQVSRAPADVRQRAA